MIITNLSGSSGQLRAARQDSGVQYGSMLKWTVSMLTVEVLHASESESGFIGQVSLHKQGI